MTISDRIGYTMVSSVWPVVEKVHTQSTHYPSAERVPRKLKEAVVLVEVDVSGSDGTPEKETDEKLNNTNFISKVFSILQILQKENLFSSFSINNLQILSIYLANSWNMPVETEASESFTGGHAPLFLWSITRSMIIKDRNQGADWIWNQQISMSINSNYEKNRIDESLNTLIEKPWWLGQFFSKFPVFR